MATATVTAPATTLQPYTYLKLPPNPARAHEIIPEASSINYPLPSELSPLSDIPANVSANEENNDPIHNNDPYKNAKKLARQHVEEGHDTPQIGNRWWNPTSYSQYSREYVNEFKKALSKRNPQQNNSFNSSFISPSRQRRNKTSKSKTSKPKTRRQRANTQHNNNNLSQNEIRNAQEKRSSERAKHEQNRRERALVGILPIENIKNELIQKGVNWNGLSLEQARQFANNVDQVGWQQAVEALLAENIITKREEKSKHNRNKHDREKQKLLREITEIEQRHIALSNPIFSANKQAREREAAASGAKERVEQALQIQRDVQALRNVEADRARNAAAAAAAPSGSQHTSHTLSSLQKELQRVEDEKHEVKARVSDAERQYRIGSFSSLYHTPGFDFKILGQSHYDLSNMEPPRDPDERPSWHNAPPPKPVAQQPRKSLHQFTPEFSRMYDPHGYGSQFAASLHSAPHQRYASQHTTPHFYNPLHDEARQEVTRIKAAQAAAAAARAAAELAARIKESQKPLPKPVMPRGWRPPPPRISYGNNGNSCSSKLCPGSRQGGPQGAKEAPQGGHQYQNKSKRSSTRAIRKKSKKYFIKMRKYTARKK